MLQKDDCIIQSMKAIDTLKSKRHTYCSYEFTCKVARRTHEKYSRVLHDVLYCPGFNVTARVTNLMIKLLIMIRNMNGTSTGTICGTQCVPN